MPNVRPANVQIPLFDAGHWWDDIWRGMPTFVNEFNKPAWELVVHLRSETDFERYKREVSHCYRDKFHWVPDRGVQAATLWYGSWFNGILPRYPVYIVSKGRWESRHTAKDLERCQVPYHIAVEPQEADRYREVIAPDKVLVTPFSNLGQGSIPVRNFVWEHARSRGAERFWTLDDNMYGTYRLHQNKKLRAPTGACYRAVEDFVDRYENVDLAGLQYRGLCDQNKIRNPVILNTRIYSCILIRTDLRLGVEGVGQWGGIGTAGRRWGGGGLAYNEDTDLSLRALKNGRCTVLFNALLADKIATLQTKGGNTEELYGGVNSTYGEWQKHAESCETCSEERRTFCATANEMLMADGRYRMAKALLDRHPDVTTITRKWGRWQHSVRYETFRDNPLKLRHDVQIPNDQDEYGMALGPMPEELVRGRTAEERERDNEDDATDAADAVATTGREKPYRSIRVYFDDPNKVAEFGQRLGQPRVKYGTAECWWPEARVR